MSQISQIEMNIEIAQRSREIAQAIATFDAKGFSCMRPCGLEYIRQPVDIFIVGRRSNFAKFLSPL